VFVDSNVPADGESFLSAWPSGRATVEAVIAGSGGFWPPLAAADYEGQGLTDEQIARIVAGGTRRAQSGAASSVPGGDAQHVARGHGQDLRGPATVGGHRHFPGRVGQHHEITGQRVGEGGAEPRR
jgi:hypothetical protein